MTEFDLNIPEVPELAEKVPYITRGRVARKLSVMAMRKFLTNDIVRRGILPTKRTKLVLNNLESHLNPNSTPDQIVLDHLFAVRDEIFLLANTNEHFDEWMRDFEYSQEHIDDPPLHDHVLRSHEKRQRPNGQIPTAVGIWGSTPWHFADDESTLLYIISATSLISKDKETFLTPEREEAVDKAVWFTKQHVHDSLYVTPKGERRGWIDAFIHPRSDVITQNQGLYAVALMGLNSVGYGIGGWEIVRAKDSYRKLAEKRGYLPYSGVFDEAIGPGSLHPEYYAITRFGQRMLSDQIVEDTIANLPRSRYGVKVLATSPKGDYFDPTCFVKLRGKPYEKGDYQNGGIWRKWWNDAMVVGELHGVLDGEDRNYRKVILDQEDATNWSEYSPTGGEYEEKLIGIRPWHVWDVSVPATHKVVDKVLSRAA